jgi:hypothetical protein
MQKLHFAACMMVALLGPSAVATAQALQTNGMQAPTISETPVAGTTANTPVRKGSKWATETVSQAPIAPTSAVTLGVFAGVQDSLIEGMEDAYGSSTGFSVGAEGAYSVNDNTSAVVRYQYFSRPGSEGLPSWSQNFLNAGMRIKGFGGGLSITSVEGMSGTGLYLEYASSGPGLTYLLKLDIVSMNGAQAGAATAAVGYAFGK